MEYKELASKSVDELKAAVSDLRKESFNLRFQVAAGEMNNFSRFRQIRRDIARAMTALKQKKVKG